MLAIAVDQGLPGAAFLADNGLDQGQVCHRLVLGCLLLSLPYFQHCLSSPSVFSLRSSTQAPSLLLDLEDERRGVTSASYGLILSLLYLHTQPRFRHV